MEESIAFYEPKLVNTALIGSISKHLACLPGRVCIFWRTAIYSQFARPKPTNALRCLRALEASTCADDIIRSHYPLFVMDRSCRRHGDPATAAAADTRHRQTHTHTHKLAQVSQLSSDRPVAIRFTFAPVSSLVSYLLVSQLALPCRQRVAPLEKCAINWQRISC